MVIVTMELRTASTFHVEDGILTEDEVLHNSLNIRLSELFDSTTISSTPASKNDQLPSMVNRTK
jgi:hypothetical protein